MSSRTGKTVAPVARPPSALSRPASRSQHARAPSASGSRTATTRPVASTSTSAKTPASDSITVVCRCRGLNSSELSAGNISIAKTAATQGTDITITTSGSQADKASSASALGPSLSPVKKPAQETTKRYTFDAVFGPDADQSLVYTAISPMLDAAIAGYSGTVLSYGQTGAGKTYSMEGDLTPELGTFSPGAGIIPRTLHRLFDMLEDLATEYAVRCSYVELYNETLRDLNASPSGSQADAAPLPKSGRASALPGGTAKADGPVELKLYDDKRGVVIIGLEETLITNAAEGIAVLKRGSERRQVAATNCNEQSSRSHAIFTIQVHVKETASVGGTAGGSEDILRTGKLHLVDLAGSESVGRSGAKDSRAREAGMINQSLLTLGRVINSLVDGNPHVPYRESNSLGGRTKTCIVACVSPSRANLEETLSTLDYALRARSIQNKPELNTRTTKAALLSQYAVEIERLKADLLAARERNGIYLSAQTWSDMAAEHEARRIALESTTREVELSTMQLRTTREQFEHSLRLIGARDSELRVSSEEIAGLAVQLTAMTNEQRRLVLELEDEMLLRDAHDSRRREWQDVAGKAISDTHGLRAKIARKTAVEAENARTIGKARTAFDELINQLETDLTALDEARTAQASGVSGGLEAFAKEQDDGLKSSLAQVATELDRLTTAEKTLRATLADEHAQASDQLSEADSSRQALIARLAALATQDAATSDDSIRAVTTSWAEYMSVASQSVTELVERATVAHTTAAERLAKTITALEAQREADKAALIEENTRLADRNAALERIVAAQSSASAQFQSDLLSSVASQLEAFRSAQSTALAAGVNEVRADLDADAKWRSERGKSSISQRKAAVTELQTTVTSLQTDRAALASDAQRHVGTLSQASASSTAALDAHAQAAAASRQAQHDAVASWSSAAESSVTASRQRVESSRTALGVQVDALVSSSSQACSTAAEALGTTRQAVLQISQAVVAHSDDRNLLMQTSLDSAATTLDTLIARARNHLETEIVADAPTGSTPRKRDWPDKASDSVLDGSREAALLALRPTPREPIEPAPPVQLREVISAPIAATVGKGTAMKKSIGLKERSGNVLPPNNGPSTGLSSSIRKYSC